MRLIDADDLIESFRKCYTGHLGMENSDSMMTFKSICKIINKQTTTYDQDKVVEQLEEIRVKKTCNKEKCDEKELCRICVVDDAIEIVKQVGVSDYVCKYKIKDEVIYASCNNKQIASAFCWFNECGDYKYCPYCGKKIKVVE